MKILYLCDEYPPGKHGGIGTSVKLLAREMMRLGHTVIIAGLYAPGYGGADEFVDEAIKVYRFRRGFNFGVFENELSLASRIITKLLKISGLMDRSVKKDLKAYQTELERLISDLNIDIIEMPDYNDYIRFCSKDLPFPKLSVPVIVKLHGSISYFTADSNEVIPQHVLKIERDLISNSTAVASVSKYTAQKSAGLFNYKGAVKVLYNGVATDVAFSVKKTPVQVIFTGSLVAKKGIYQLARAWNIVNKALPDARLLICGKGDQQKVVACLTKEAKGSVNFMGHLPTDELYKHLAESTIAVFPSYAEAFALAPLEAMACGTMVINSNRTSGPELISDNVNGLLIDPDNVDQIASAIINSLNDATLCERLAKKGNETVKEKFEIGKVAAAHADFYSNVLNGDIKSGN